MTTQTNRKFILIGAGGTGSILFSPLLRMLETFERNNDKPFNLIVVDGKDVRPSNLERQMFHSEHVSKNKAIALLDQFKADPRVVIAMPRYLGQEDMPIFEDNSVILIAADNWAIRRHIEEFASTLDNVSVINGGNTMRDGSMQVWLRRAGENITPPMSQNHPEILSEESHDMALLDCHQIAELPGGEQTITANMMSAAAMLNAVKHLIEWEESDSPWHEWNEVFFDNQTFAMRATAR